MTGGLWMYAQRLSARALNANNKQFNSEGLHTRFQYTKSSRRAGNSKTRTCVLEKHIHSNLHLPSDIGSRAQYITF